MNPYRPHPRLPARWLALISVLPATAMAHPGHYHPGEEDEFDTMVAGLLHPLGGMDHLLLALAVGWLAFAWLGGKARVFSLLAFLAALGGGAWVGRGIQASAGLEIAISSTLILAGIAFLVGKHSGLGAFTGALAAAGLIHGFAHGAEAAATVVFPLYAAGFLMGTAALLGAGAMLHFAAAKVGRLRIPRIAGIALLCLGSFSLFQAL